MTVKKAKALRDENARLIKEWRTGWELTRDTLATLRELFLPFEDGRARPLDEAELMRRIFYVGEAHSKAAPPEPDNPILAPAAPQKSRSRGKKEKLGGKGVR